MILNFSSYGTHFLYSMIFTLTSTNEKYMKMTKSRSNRFQAVKSKSPLLKLSFSNIRGLRTNFGEVSHFLQSRSPDIFAVSETKLDASVSSSEFTPDGYTFHRFDKAPCHGLALYAKTNLPLRRMKQSEDPRHEYLAFIAPLKNVTFLLFFLYRSPSADSEVFDVISTKIDALLQRYPAAEVAVFGDFNVHNVEWLVHSRATDSSGQAAEAFALSHNLSQIVTSPTRVPDRAGDTGYLLDLFLTSTPENFSHKISSPLGSSDHCVVTVNHKQASSIPSVPFHRTVYRYSAADWCGFRTYLSDASSQKGLIITDDVHESAQNLEEVIQNGMKAYIPHRSYQVKPHSQPWFTPECAAAICQRDHFFNQYKRDRTAGNLDQYRAARRHCKETLHEAKRRYSSHIQDSIANQKLGSKDFWRIYNSVTNRNKSSIPALNRDDSNMMATTSAEKAELLSSQFAKNSSLDDNRRTPPTLPLRTSDTIPSPVITVKRVKRIISCLDNSKASGPDGIPVIVFKKLSPELSPVLAKLFKKCVSVSLFPPTWKVASVVPVPKKGCDSSQPTSYRPISLLPIAGKIFEAMINKSLVDFLESHHLLSDTQYGFRFSRSTGDLLSYVTEHISRILDRQGETQTVALDISKAFDKVWHKGLLSKLSSYGISGPLHQLIASFLSNRQISVVLDGQKSSTKLINAGVPQGSILGPTLFLLYINDLPDSIVSKLVMYADDTTLFNSVERPNTQLRQQLCDVMNKDLQTIADWGTDWLVSFNSSKTQSVLHSRRRNRESSQPSLQMSNSTLQDQPSVSLLGLTVSSDLSWKSYIQSISKKASQRIGSLYRASRYLHPQSTLYLYKSTIRPLMEYCCHIWAGAPKTHLTLLDRVERRAKNLIGQQLANELLPLSHRRDVASLSLFYRYYHGRCSSALSESVPKPKVFSRATRRADSGTCYQVNVERTRTKSRSNSFFVRTAQLWNELPKYCFPAQYDLGSFKRRVNRFLKPK